MAIIQRSVNIMSTFNKMLSHSKLLVPLNQGTYKYYSQERKQAKHYPVKLEPMLPKDTFKGKIAFVTGGGTGLGKGITYALSLLGAKVVISSRKLDVLKLTAEELSKQTQNEIIPISCDIRDPMSVQSAVDECVSIFGLPDLIVNNAAGNFISPTERLSPNAWRTIVDIVLNGTAYVTLDIGKRLIKENKGGVFLAISTTYAKSGSGFVVPSACSKAGVETLTKSLAAEWGRYGIRFNCIAPGAIETKGAFSRLLPSDDLKDAVIKLIPAARMGEIPELANLAIYMLSDYGSWLNGAIIPFDGGHAVNIAGVKNGLQKLTSEQWDEITARIRKVKGS